jgi:hypothetical protein
MSKTGANGAGKPRGRPRGPTGPTVTGGSRDARRVAAVLLEVLAGHRTPMDAAGALGVSLPRYYALESRAVAGLVLACESRARGRRPSLDREVARLRAEVERLERASARSQALLRLSQRVVGVAAPATAPAGKAAGGKRRVRRPVARALKAARKLSSDASLPEEPASAKSE